MMNQYLGYWIKRYLGEYIISVCNLSMNTLKSYRDTFRLLFRYIFEEYKILPDKVTMSDLTRDVIVEFLEYIETSRHVSISSRNTRLSALKAFAKYLELEAPEYIEWCRIIRDIPKKNGKKRLITYLEKDEMDALLKLPNRQTPQGRRDYALLMFLYNTGARAEEVVSLQVSNIVLPLHKSDSTIPVVTFIGKGGKVRRCPLWQSTVEIMRPFIQGKDESEPIFLNRQGQAMTRFGVYETITKYRAELIDKKPSTKYKRLSPHTIRHTTATHLLQAGVDINIIRSWLGHVSIDTTNIYAEVNIEMKKRAIDSCIPECSEMSQNDWHRDESLLSFLDNL